MSAQRRRRVDKSKVSYMQRNAELWPVHCTCVGTSSSTWCLTFLDVKKSKIERNEKPTVATNQTQGWVLPVLFYWATITKHIPVRTILSLCLPCIINLLLERHCCGYSFLHTSMNTANHIHRELVWIGNQWTINISPEKVDLDVMQSHPLRRTHFGQDQALSVALGWLKDRDCCLMRKMQSGGWMWLKVIWEKRHMIPLLH